MFNAKIKTAPSQRIADTPLLVGCEYNKRNAPGSNRSEFRNAQLPNTQEFQQRGFKCVVHFIQFVDQQDTRLFILEGAQQRPGAEKLLAMQFGLQGLPIDVAGLRFQLDAKPLQRLVEFPNGFLFIDALVALQAFDNGFRCIRDSVCQLSLSAAGGAFEQQWLLQLRRQIHGCRGNRIGDVARGPQPLTNFFKR